MSDKAGLAPRKLMEMAIEIMSRIVASVSLKGRQRASRDISRDKVSGLGGSHSREWSIAKEIAPLWRDALSG